MSTLAKPFWTPEQYLERERQAEGKSEYFSGEIFAMAGASREHNLIAGNASGELRARLKGRPCETYPSDMRVRVNATGLCTYPDVTVVCGEPEFLDRSGDVLLNPRVIVEVLSESTEAYDRGEKFAHYRRVESLQDYLLIAQEKASVEHYARQPGDQWLLTVYTELSDSLILPSLDCRLPLSELYDRMQFNVAP